MEPLSDPNLTLEAIAERITRREQEIEALKRRLAGLRSKERELQDAVIEFESVWGLNPTEKPSPSPLPDILDGAEKVLRRAGGGPMFSREIWKKLEEAGVHVSGNDPASNLSAKLSQAKDRFVSQGRGKGWCLPSTDGSEKEEEKKPEESRTLAALLAEQGLSSGDDDSPI